MHNDPDAAAGVTLESDTPLPSPAPDDHLSGATLISVNVPLFTLKLVQFDADAKVTSGGWVVSEDGSSSHLDWALGSTTPEDLSSVLQTFQPYAYGVYNLITGEHYLKGFTGELTPAHTETWERLTADLPLVAPLGVPSHDSEPVAGDVDSDLVGEDVDPEEDARKQRQAAEALAQRLAHHMQGFDAGLATQLPTLSSFDIASVMQGLHIASDAARARRAKHPDSTPETSVTAVESLPAVIKGLVKVIECYQHLGRLALHGVDVRPNFVLLESAIGNVAGVVPPDVA